MTRAHGKQHMMAAEIARRLEQGQRVIVATPGGTIDGEQWLRNRGLVPPCADYPEPRIARGE